MPIPNLQQDTTARCPQNARTSSIEFRKLSAMQSDRPDRKEEAPPEKVALLFWARKKFQKSTSFASLIHSPFPHRTKSKERSAARKRSPPTKTANPLPLLLENIHPRQLQAGSPAISRLASPQTFFSPSAKSRLSELRSQDQKKNTSSRKRKLSARKRDCVRKLKRQKVDNEIIGQPFNVRHTLHVNQDLLWDTFEKGTCAADLFTLGDKLGEGAYGVVFKAVQKQSGFTLVVKEIAIQPDKEDAIRKEIDILKSCRHQNIVQYFGSCASPEPNKFWILMEFCAHNSLRDIIETCDRPLLENELLVIISETLKGLTHLHCSTICHRDIKAANILIAENACVKIADFGVSENMHTVPSSEIRFVGTPLWMAPELINGAMGNRRKEYDMKSADIWSLGITVLELAEGVPPHAEKRLNSALRLIPVLTAPRFESPKKWSAELNDFLALCLHKSPEERPRVFELLSHPWIVKATTLDAAKVLDLLLKTYTFKKRLRKMRKEAGLTASTMDSSEYSESTGTSFYTPESGLSDNLRTCDMEDPLSPVAIHQERKQQHSEKRKNRDCIDHNGNRCSANSSNAGDEYSTVVVNADASGEKCLGTILEDARGQGAADAGGN
eukprot:TRINITY_DN17894_c0_g1_i1.p1 TRINITY_DN17894_c0_g1~~TRINITY_DN17894_c0_g1_i1.p1  ORF type:complete len:612 (-),score=97.54 TRINITY_DN17894_c0_g1_i1:46-1881(-)